MAYKTAKRFEHLIGFLVSKGGEATFDEVKTFLGDMAYRYAVFIYYANLVPGVKIETVKERGRVVAVKLTNTAGIVKEREPLRGDKGRFLPKAASVEKARREGKVVAMGV